MLLLFHQTQSSIYLCLFSYENRATNKNKIFICFRNMTDLMIKDDVIAFIGPDESCLYEALVASAWNLPIISYVS